MNKIYAVLYVIILLFAIIARVFECTFEALLESRCTSLGYFVEVFKFMWSDDKHYTPVSQHWENIKNEWKG